jgi:hypothetical protein
MTFRFTNDSPYRHYETPEVISGKDSLQFTDSEYLIMEQEDHQRVFEIRYECHYSPFKEAAILNNLLLVGFEGHFYLYDLLENENIMALEMDGYFGHLYINQNTFYVTDAAKLYCINDKGKIIWKNDHLGIDGVIIDSFSKDKIYGSGEWDPPGGWKDFVIDLKTGQTLIGR